MENEINKKIVINSLIWKVLERAISQGLNLVIQVVLARLVVPEAFGELAILIAILNFASIFVQSGFSTAIIQKKTLDSQDISTSLILSLSLASVMYIIIFAASPYIANYFDSTVITVALRVLALILFLNAINSIQTAILSRRMQFKTIFFRSIIAVPISGFVSIIMAINGFGIWSLIFFNLTSMLLTSLIMMIGAKLAIKFNFSWVKAKEIYSFSSKILITSFITVFYDSIRAMAIGSYYSKEDLAFFDKGYTYSSYATQAVSSSITSVMLPSFSRKQEDINRLQQMVRQSVKVSTFIMFPLLAGIAAISTPLIRLILTDDWIKAASFLMIFCILRIPGVFISIEKQAYYAIGKSGVALLYEIIITSINILLLVIFIEKGPIIIAIGATLVEYLGVIVISILSNKIINYKIRDRIKDLGATSVSTIILFSITWSIHFLNISTILTMILQIVVGIITYLALAVITKNDILYYIVRTIKEKVTKH